MGILLAAGADPRAGGAQAVRLPEGAPADTSGLHDAAKRAQADFERLRLRLLPTVPAGTGLGCDEQVGRFCIVHDENGWWPPPEPPELAEARQRLLTALDSLGRLGPGNGWLMGQRVWYRGEAGRWDEALAVAGECGAERWWCEALRGLAYHQLERFPEAEDAFRGALARMDTAQARRWEEPTYLLQGAARKIVERAAGPRRGDLVAWLWTLADPLWLVPGNDRRTEHLARWTVTVLRDGARNPHQLPWGRDLEELTVRNGWELGWERERSWDLSRRGGVVGYKHPEGREFLPAAAALTGAPSATAEAFEVHGEEARSLYAPAYAPLFLPMDGQVAAFPRGDSVLLVATHFIPEDTTRGRREGLPRPWLADGAPAGLPDRAGLFLLAEGGAQLATTHDGGEGVLLLAAPAGSWVVSAEAWSPSSRRAGRLRTGLRRDSVPPGVPTLSDPLLVRGGGGDPTRLEEAVRGALPRAEVPPGEPVALLWELNGLGWRPETVGYELVVQRAHRGILRRLGEGLGLLGRDRPLSLAWSEAGPARPEPVLRRVDLSLGDAAPGRYVVRLTVRLAGRWVINTQADFEVPAPQR